MPRPRKEHEAEKESDRLATCSTNPRLLANGEPSPWDFTRNLQDYEHTCPRAEYVHSAIAPTMIELAIKWKVRHEQLTRWKAVGNWDIARLREWKGIERRAWELSKEGIAQVQSKELETQLEHWRSLRDHIKALQRQGGQQEQTATGDVRFAFFNTRDLKDMAATLQMCDGEIGRILGMGKGLLKLGESEADDKASTRARRVVHVYARVQEEFETQRDMQGDENAPRALPEAEAREAFGEVLDSITEGELVQ